MSEICEEILTKVIKGEDEIKTLIKKLPKNEVSQLISALKNLKKEELDKFFIYVDLLRKTEESTKKVEEKIQRELIKYRSLNDRVKAVLLLLE